MSKSVLFRVANRFRLEYHLSKILGRGATPYEIREIMVTLWPELVPWMPPVLKNAFYYSGAVWASPGGNRAYCIDGNNYWRGRELVLGADGSVQVG